MLFASVMSLNFSFTNLFQFHELGFVLKACQNYLISTEVNDWIREDVNDLSEDFFNKFVGLLKSNIQRTHVSMSKSAGNVFILRSFSPTCCMTWCIKFRDDSYTSDHGISDELSGISCCISLLWTEGGMLCNFRM